MDELIQRKESVQESIKEFKTEILIIDREIEVLKKKRKWRKDKLSWEESKLAKINHELAAYRGFWGRVRYSYKPTFDHLKSETRGENGRGMRRLIVFFTILLLYAIFCFGMTFLTYYQRNGFYEPTEEFINESMDAITKSIAFVVQWTFWGYLGIFFCFIGLAILFIILDPIYRLIRLQRTRKELL